MKTNGIKLDSYSRVQLAVEALRLQIRWCNVDVKETIPDMFCTFPLVYSKEKGGIVCSRDMWMGDCTPDIADEVLRIINEEYK